MTGEAEALPARKRTAGFLPLVALYKGLQPRGENVVRIMLTQAVSRGGLGNSTLLHVGAIVALGLLIGVLTGSFEELPFLLALPYMLVVYLRLVAEAPLLPRRLRTRSAAETVLSTPVETRYYMAAFLGHFSAVTVVCVLLLLVPVVCATVLAYDYRSAPVAREFFWDLAKLALFVVCAAWLAYWCHLTGGLVVALPYTLLVALYLLVPVLDALDFVDAAMWLYDDAGAILFEVVCLCIGSLLMGQLWRDYADRVRRRLFP